MPTPPAMAVLLEDDFSGDLSRWQVVTGTWAIVGGRLQGMGEGPGVDAWIYAGSETWTDYAFEARFESGPTSATAAFAVRSTGHWQNEYRIDICSDCSPQTYIFIRYRDGNSTTMKQGAVSAPLANPARIRVQAFANELRLYLDGALVDRVTDPDPLPAGRVALGIPGDARLQFDDVVVTDAVCGDGVSEPGEECDDGNLDPADGCTNACTVCGNGTVSPGEACDDGNAVNGDGCDVNCTRSACGNGVRSAGEQCDDGNTDACDGCSPTCRTEPLGYRCGDGVRSSICGEACDDGNASDNDACRNDCQRNVCGDGLRNPAAEQCDDGNTTTCDGCSDTCRTEPAGYRCGDGIVSAACNEECDDGNRVNEDACRNDCHPNVCGDGARNPATEPCDDGNTRSGDGCDANCTPTACGNGIVTAGEACDDGNLADGDGCDSNCTPTACGNGVVTAGEECDDGNRNPFDGCTRTCTICGDGVATAPEECDDGNRDPADGCTNACTTCGNGVVTPPESCDDGNLVDGDGCYAYCATPGCGNDVREGDEACDDGGICVGGDDAGTICTGPGGCLSGECQPVGGDGCAVNCTVETAQRFTLDPARSFIGFQAEYVHITPSDAPGFALSGQLTLHTGRPRPSEQTGDIPVAIGAGDVHFAPIPIAGLGCLCLRGRGVVEGGAAGAGGIACGAEGRSGIDILTSIDHDTADIDPTCANGTVEEGGACADGRCASGRHAGELCRVDVDCGTSDRHAGVCNGAETLTASGNGPPGSAWIDLQLLGQEIASVSLCEVETNTQVCRDGVCVPAKGPNGIPCDADDPLPGNPVYYGPFVPLYIEARLTTGRAGAEVVDANGTPDSTIRRGDSCGGRPCVTEARGEPFQCSDSLVVTGATLAAAFPTLDLGALGDTVTTLALALEPVVHVVGTGTPESCTEAALDAALAEGGEVAFDCGPEPVTITITSTKTITQGTTIDGGGLITISGGGQVGVFQVGASLESATSFGVRNLTIADGSASNGGGIAAIGQDSTITVADSTITRNAAGQFGGGLFGLGTLNITGSTIAGNVALLGGGVAGGACGEFGCIPAALRVANSTISGNEARIGGGLFSAGAAAVSNSTIAANAASDRGGGVFHVPYDGGELTLTHTVIADSSSGGDCVYGAPAHASGTHNLITDAEHSCGLVDGVSGNLVGVDPLLDPAGLADNGGPTQTIALLPGSPAIDAGDAAVCANPPVNGLDQRGYVRPGVGHTQCSIGAYEADAIPVSACVGDCDGDGMVAVNELILGVDIALGEQPVGACPAFRNSDRVVDIAQLITGVNNALDGCPNGEPG